MNQIKTLTPEEMKLLERNPSDVIREKIEATGSKEAIDAFNEYVGMFQTVHDGLMTWITYAMSAAYKAGGADFLTEEMKPYFKPTHAAMLEGYWDKPFKERVLFSISCFRNFHDCKIKFIGEDDEKLTFEMDPCGSGQKTVEMGLYEPTGKCSMCKAHAMTAGLDDFPIYCIHAPIGEICANELGETPIYQQDYPEKTGTCSCTIHVYKDKNKVPDSYFIRLGLKRPE